MHGGHQNVDTPCMHGCWVPSLMSYSVWPYGLSPTRLFYSRDSPSNNTGVGSHSFLQGIFPPQEWNLRLLHRQVGFLFLFFLLLVPPGKPLDSPWRPPIQCPEQNSLFLLLLRSWLSTFIYKPRAQHSIQNSASHSPHHIICWNSHSLSNSGLLTLLAIQTASIRKLSFLVELLQ